MDGSDNAGQMPGHAWRTDHHPGTQVMDWWPKALNLDILHQHDTKTNPLGDFQLS